MNARYIASAALITLCLAVPATASAATRYAEPGGNGPEPCLHADPCEIHDAAAGHAASDVVDGDEIILLPGDYSITQQVDLVDPNLNFHGQSGQPRPRIVSTASAGVFTGQAGVRISHLELEQSGDHSGIVTNSGANNVLIEGVRVHTFNPNSFSFTCQLLGTVTLKNSVCWSSGLAGAAIGINTSGGRATVTLRNVTAVSSASTNSTGIYYGGNLGGTNLSVTATNVIADGVTDDVYASASSGASSTITLDHSNYDTESQSGTATITDPGSGTNQTAAPVYVDAATGGFHQASASPTVDQGVNDAANGTVDIDLEARISNAATDIGADEFVVTDIDGDGVPNGADECPSGDGGWTSNATTDHDADGCRDSTEDVDDDNDGKADGADACPAGSTGWTSTSITDHDSDGCRDGVEDGDQDSDGKLDGGDGCPAGDTGWTSDGTTDRDNDGCRDATEDSDDDNDTVIDGADNCPLVANADQADLDGDGGGDACDATDDRPQPPTAETPPGDSEAADQQAPPADQDSDATDRVAPDTVIDRAPAKGVQKRRARVTFHSTEPASRFECSLDRAAFAPCSSPLRIRAAAGRRHRLKVRAIDAAGNVDPTPAVVRWRVRAR